MCGCEASFVCSKCAGTPFDPNYEADAHEPMDTGEFDALVVERSEPRAFGDLGWV
jgi:hypothetical protein